MTDFDLPEMQDNNVDVDGVLYNLIVKKFETLVSWFDAYRKRNGIEYDTSYLDGEASIEYRYFDTKWSSTDLVVKGRASDTGSFMRLHLVTENSEKRICIEKRFECNHVLEDADLRAIKYITSHGHVGLEEYAKFFEKCLECPHALDIRDAHRVQHDDGRENVLHVVFHVTVKHGNNGNIGIHTYFPVQDELLHFGSDDIDIIKKRLERSISEIGNEIELVSKRGLFGRICVNYESYEIERRFCSINENKVDKKTGKYEVFFDRSVMKRAEKLLGDLLIARMYNTVVLSIVNTIESENLSKRLLERYDLILVDKILSRTFSRIKEKHAIDRDFAKKYVDELKKIEDRPIEDPIVELENCYKEWNKNEKSVDNKI